jgi:hypothetical protein
VSARRDYSAGGLRIPRELDPPKYMDDWWMGLAFAVYLGVIVVGFVVLLVIGR